MYQTPKYDQRVKRNKFIIVLLVIGLLAVIAFLVYRGSLMRFTGMLPSKSDIGVQSNIVLSFSKNISNPDAVIASLAIQPELNKTVLVEKNTVTIVPIDPYKIVTYTIKIPLISAGSRNITNFSTQFTPLAAADTTNEETNIDLDDLIIKQYPKLIEVDEEKIDYKISYSLDNQTVVFDLLLLESMDRSVSEEEAINLLKKHNQEARSYIAQLGVPKDKYIIRYTDSVQAEIIYGETGAPTTN